MTITHTWKIDIMRELNNDLGVVSEVSYSVHSTNGNISTKSGSTVELKTENIENFISYEDLTEEIVLGWVKERLGKNLGNHEVNNASWIDSIENPPAPRTISKELPW